MHETLIKDLNPAFCKTDVSGSPLSELYLMDCLDGMKHYPDKYFDLAIVDPPYGINFAETIEKNTWNRNLKNKHSAKNWDLSIPQKEYFVELFRVSKNQIIFGGNYFMEFLPSTSCFIIWFKSQNFTGADVELAWTSFKSPSRSFKLSRIQAHGNENKIHPTQKNIKIYNWILDKYAKQNDKILDTHSGSGSLRISCHQNKFDFVGFEIDKEYFDNSNKRFENVISQQRLF